MAATSSSSEPDFQAVYDFSIQLALTAGKMISDASTSRSADNNITSGDASKKNRVDLVTATDQAVEAFVKAEIAKAYPDFAFIGEESFAAGERGSLTEAPTFIVDPIDGTTNFVHGFDVIYNPFLLKLYSARAGHGAWLNQTTRLPLSYPSPPSLASLGDALIGAEWGSDRRGLVMDKKVSTFIRLAGDPKDIPRGVMAHSLRSIGSAALNYSYVSTGQLDCYHEIGCHSWDVCAGTIIAQEAGGKVYGRGGKSWEDQDLMDHYYFVVRAIGDTASETGEQAQDRIAKEFFAVAEDWDV